MDAIGSGGLEEFGRRLRAGETSARAAVESCLARIEAEDNALRSFVHVAADAARRSADTIDRRLSAGEELGPLMGVPVAVKDLFAVEGMPASAGSRLDVALVIGNEGPFVKRLKEIGAVVLGKTRTIEFAAGGHNLGHPIPCNPADRSRHRSPGGSSSGSAVAVAAGLCPLAVGSDTGGSVRFPAALCGITGYKSTYGRYSTEGVFPLCHSMDCVGLFAAAPGDLSVALAAIDGAPMSDAAVNVSGLRLGVPPDHLFTNLDDTVAQTFEAALVAFGRAGATLVRVDWPDRSEVQTVADIFAGLVPAESHRHAWPATPRSEHRSDRSGRAGSDFEGRGTWRDGVPTIVGRAERSGSPGRRTDVGTRRGGSADIVDHRGPG